MGNGQVVPVSNFAISPESVVQVKQGESLTVFTSTNEPQRIEKVKVIDANGLETELLPLSTQNTQYSLNNLNVGVYTLDIIVDDSGGLLGYETIVVILAPGQQPIQSTEIVRIVSRVSDDEDDNDLLICTPDQIVVDGKCVPLACPEGFARSGGEDGRCIPICDENTQPGTTCYDEGDPDTCEPGFVDRGFGCEREDDGRPVCTPDGPPCPPCPEGVEAGWCADEDEQQDEDDPLPPPEEETEEEDAES
jgi:hypothetical protein